MYVNLPSKCSTIITLTTFNSVSTLMKAVCGRFSRTSSEEST